MNAFGKCVGHSPKIAATENHFCPHPGCEQIYLHERGVTSHCKIHFVGNKAHLGNTKAHGLVMKKCSNGVPSDAPKSEAERIFVFCLRPLTQQRAKPSQSHAHGTHEWENDSSWKHTAPVQEKKSSANKAAAALREPRRRSRLRWQCGLTQRHRREKGSEAWLWKSKQQGR